VSDPTGDPRPQSPSWPAGTPSDPAAPAPGAAAPGGDPTAAPANPYDPAAMPTAYEPAAPAGTPYNPYVVPAYPVRPGDFYEVSGYGYGTGYAGVGHPTGVLDPLVTWPSERFAGWWRRVWATFGRSGGTLFGILVLTQAVPSILFSLVTFDLLRRMLVVDNTTYPQTATMDWSIAGRFFGWAAVYLVVTVFLGAAGWVAGVWAITRRSAGAPAPIGAALAYGFRNCLRVGAWLIPCMLMIIAGSVACLLPGLYFALATSLIVPVAVYQRRSPIGGTFRLVNSNFGAMLGRMSLIFVLATGIDLVGSLIVGGLRAAGTVGTTTAEPLHLTAYDVISTVASSLLGAATSSILVVAVTLAYAEMRAREWPTTVHDLNAALDG